MKLPVIPLAQTVIKLCELKDIKHIVISPGSRSAPLTIGFTGHSYFKCYSIVDERSAAFFALGIAQQLQEPVAVVCTSGSALLNYYPAIAEAYYSNIPLVVLSADRPKHLINVGDGQTINQKNVFVNHILYSANLKLDVKDEKNIPFAEELPIIKSLEDKFERFFKIQQDIQAYNEEEINNALNVTRSRKGPVHINIPLEEPLYQTTDQFNVDPKLIEARTLVKDMDAFVLRECNEIWMNSQKKMILVGESKPNTLQQQWLDELAHDNSVIVFTETTSNLHHSGFFQSIDKMIMPLTEDDYKELQPDVLITFGGMIVSKKVKAFLRKYQPKHHWHIDERHANDTFFCLERHIKVTPNRFFSELLPKITHVIKSKYKSRWEQIKQHRIVKHKEYLNKISFSDLKVFGTLVKHLPNNVMLQVANSSPIRYLQLFDMNPSVKVYCNRGTSGIDGCSSTAVGAATVYNGQTVLITGDLGFFYDSNALWNNYIPKHFRIIIINNEGGGIFRILPGHKNTANFDRFFETKHQLKAKPLCELYGLEYYRSSNEEDLNKELSTFFAKSEKPKLLEIFTPRTKNDEILLNYFKYIK